MNFIYILKHDGKEIKKFITVRMALEYLHNHQPQSWDYAFTYGGYSLWLKNDDGSQRKIY